MSAFKLLTVASLLGAAVASLTINAPTNPVLGQDTEATWNWSGDRPGTEGGWTLFLITGDEFFGTVGIYDIEDPASGKQTIHLDAERLGSIPEEQQYDFQIANSSNVDFRYGVSPHFTISHGA